jgi:hypothetical protein
MQTLEQTYHPSYTGITKKQSPVVKFFSWCHEQEKYRFGWLAAILAIHGCVLAPITVLAITLSGNNMIFWGLVIGGMAMALIVNLAALPTKITIPVFFLSVLIDLAVIVAALASVLN